MILKFLYSFKSRIKRFEKYLEEKILYFDLSSVEKSTVMDYLNMVLDTSSTRNRNNTRTDIQTLALQVLEG